MSFTSKISQSNGDHESRQKIINGRTHYAKGKPQDEMKWIGIINRKGEIRSRYFVDAELEHFGSIPHR